jgi:hypothetical protein
MQALEDAIATFEIDFPHESPLYSIGSELWDSVMSCGELNTPKPSQDVRGKHSDAASCRDASERFLSSWFAVGKLVSANDDGNKAGDFRYRAGEEGLQSGEPSIKGRSALSVGREWN